MSAQGYFPLSDPNITPSGCFNRFMNGDFAVSPTSGSVADGATIFQNWRILTQSANVTVSQLTAPEPGQTFALRITQANATAQRFGFSQTMLQADCVDLRTAFVSMAARLRQSTTGAIRFALLSWPGTADSVTADIVNDWTSTTYTPGQFFISSVEVINQGVFSGSADTWRSLPVIPFQCPDDMNNLIGFVWTQDAVAQNGTMDAGAVQCALGQAQPSYEHRPYYLEQVMSTQQGGGYLLAANNLDDVDNVSTSRTNLGLGTAATQNTGTSGATLPFANGTNIWANTQTFTVAPVFTDATGTRTALGLGTAATQNTGTSGANVPLLNGANTWSAGQVVSTATAKALELAGANDSYLLIYNGASTGQIFLQTGTSAVNFGTLNDKPVKLYVNSVVQWVIAAGVLYPDTDNAVAFGSGTNRPTVLYAVSGTINTSDAREKTPLSVFTEAETRALRAASRLPGVFQWLDSVERKGGDAARLHVGPLAQDVAGVFTAEGLDPRRYAFFCADPWLEDYEYGVEMVGDKERPAIKRRQRVDPETGAPMERLGLRHEQLLWGVSAVLRADMDALATRIEELGAA